MTQTPHKVLLIVDDSRPWLAFLSTSIADIRDAARLTVLTCESGASALALLTQHRVDLVVTDTNMPGMSGLELLAKIKARFPALPVIVQFSGLVGSDITEQEVSQSGASEVLTKGAFYDRLAQLIEKYLGP